MRDQLQPHGITVFEALPPVVDTDIASVLKSDNFKKMKPADLMRDILDGLRRNQTEMLLGQSRQIKLLSRIAPAFLFRQFAKTEFHCPSTAGPPSCIPISTALPLGSIKARRPANFFYCDHKLQRAKARLHGDAPSLSISEPECHGQVTTTTSRRLVDRIFLCMTAYAYRHTALSDLD